MKNKTKFKTLVIKATGHYVDVGMLPDGLYAAKRPTIYDANETIGGLIKRASFLAGPSGNAYIASYLENLKKCELREIKITLT